MSQELKNTESIYNYVSTLGETGVFNTMTSNLTDGAVAAKKMKLPATGRLYNQYADSAIKQYDAQKQMYTVTAELVNTIATLLKVPSPQSSVIAKSKAVMLEESAQAMDALKNQILESKISEGEMDSWVGQENYSQDGQNQFADSLTGYMGARHGYLSDVSSALGQAAANEATGVEGLQSQAMKMEETFNDMVKIHNSSADVDDELKGLIGKTADALGDFSNTRSASADLGGAVTLDSISKFD